MRYANAFIEWEWRALGMKSEFEICNKALSYSSDVMICSFECKYCIDCAKNLNKICKNYNGELTIRPKREVRN